MLISFDIDGTIVPSKIDYSFFGNIFSPFFPLMCLVFKFIKRNECSTKFISFYEFYKEKVDIVLITSRPAELTREFNFKGKILSSQKGLSWHQAKEEKIQKVIEINPDIHVDNSPLIIRELLNSKTILPILVGKRKKGLISIDSLDQLGSIIEEHINY